MKTKLAGMIAIALAIGGNAQARPGETEAQVASRYGVAAGSQPVTGHDALGNEQRTYRLHNYITVVTFENGESICEAIQKRAEKTNEKLFRRNEIDALLAAYTAAGVTWKTDPNGRGWDSADGKLRAIKGPQVLEIYNPAYDSQLAALAKKKAAEAYFGFSKAPPH